MPGAKIQPNNPANDPNLKPIKGYSKFQPNMSLYKTHTFGLIEPHFAFDVVPDDKKVQYRSGTDIDTQNLKAPLMTPMRAMKDTFFVPIRALLPHNADLLVTNPLTGQDIDPEQVNTLLFFNTTQNGSYYFGDALEGMMHRWWRTVAGYTGNSGTTGFTDSDAYMAQLLESNLVAYSLLAPIFSYGSLAQSLGYNFAFGFTGLRHDNGDRMNFDQTFDILMSFIKAHVKSFYITLGIPNITAVNAAPTIDRQTLLVRCDVDHNNLENVNQYYCLRAILELIAQGYFPSAVSDLVLINPADTTVYFSDVASGYSRQTTSGSSFVWWSRYADQISTGALGEQVNINRLIGYQLLCASFYTDDAIDYVYTAKLWHENMWSLFRNIYYNNLNGLRKAYYMLNGVEMQYDITSAALVQDVLNGLTALNSYTWSTGTIPGSGGYAQFSNEVSVFYEHLAFYYNIFGYQRSLRYRDYFVGARTLPLAVGDVNVQVNSNLVNVVDVTKKIQMQRFLNQVNRVGRRIREYSAGIFGVAPKKDTDEVIFLSHIAFNIGAEETSNTGPAQLTAAQTTTSKLRKNGSNFIFDSDFTEFGVVLGVTYFDVVRPLVDGLDRTLLHRDRFEMFNPFMQNIGDQPVEQLEICPVSGGGYFGYKLRYSEYKQRTDRVAGGFVNYLPGFAFPTDVNDLANPFSSTPLNLKISPDFIRSKPHEFDKFFNSLTTYSPAGYFHFIIRHDNEVDANRPMESAPSIL